jgi:hypothetical protein
MAGRRILRVLAVLGLLSSAGCRTWCDHWYPATHPGACYAPAACQPCCCTPCGPAAGYQAAPSAGWNQPAPCPAGCVPASH